MPVKMTRSEYEAKYGSAPQPAAAAAPVKMTAAQYEAKYGTAPKPITPEKSLGDKLGDRYRQGMQGAADQLKKGGTGMSPVLPIPGGRTFLQAAGAAGGAVDDVIGAGIEKIVPDAVEKKIGEIVAPVAAPVVKAGKKIFGTLESVSPETAQDVKDAANAANLFVGGAVTRVPAKAAVKAVVPEATEATIAAKVASDFKKGVKPAIAGTTKGQMDKQTNQIVDAVKLMQENVPNLKFMDDTGEVVSGRAPQSVFELSDALDQTKRSVFQTYSVLPKAAGERGLTINPAGIADELETVASNKALQLSNPEAIKYAQTVRDRYRDIGNLDPEIVQDVIKNMNESLKAFYRNPTYTDASRAAIDAMVVNNLRKLLDEGVEKLTGEAYQAIKNQYQSLKAVERDIVRAAAREAKKGTKGLIDYTDIFTGADLIGGILTLSPGAVARGAAGRAFKEFYKYLNDPNRAIERMFKNAEKLPARSLFKK
jgi:uncharacterized protein YbjQ (UPF0145 family)